MNQEKLDIDDLLMDKGFRNWAMEVTDDESQFWEMLKEEGTHFKESMNQARELVLTAEEDLDLIDTKTNGKMLVSLKSRLGWNHMSVEKNRPAKAAIYWKIAASVALLLAFGVFAFYNSQKEIVEQQESVAYVEKATPKGAKLNFYLEDGTHVILNADSKIKFSPTYTTDKKREVYLSGEAYFEVAKDAERPFTVYTDQFSTTALGTIFNIDARDENETVKIALLEGSVLVKNQDPSAEVILEPGQMIRASKSNSRMAQLSFDPKAMTSWKDGVIYFNKTPFDVSMSTLERWYGVNIELKNQPETPMTCSGNFENDNLRNVLNSLGFALNFEFDIDNKNVTIKFK